MDNHVLLMSDVLTPNDWSFNPKDYPPNANALDLFLEVARVKATGEKVTVHSLEYLDSMWTSYPRSTGLVVVFKTESGVLLKAMTVEIDDRGKL